MWMKKVTILAQLIRDTAKSEGWNKKRFLDHTAHALANSDFGRVSLIRSALEDAGLTDTQCAAILVKLGYITPSRNAIQAAHKAWKKQTNH